MKWWFLLTQLLICNNMHCKYVLGCELSVLSVCFETLLLPCIVMQWKYGYLSVLEDSVALLHCYISCNQKSVVCVLGLVLSSVESAAVFLTCLPGVSQDSSYHITRWGPVVDYCGCLDCTETAHWQMARPLSWWGKACTGWPMASMMAHFSLLVFSSCTHEGWLWVPVVEKDCHWMTMSRRDNVFPCHTLFGEYCPSITALLSKHHCL